MRKVRGVRLYAPNDRAIDLSAPGYFFQATDTAGVLRWLAAEAERAGATLLYGRRFNGGVEYERGVALPSLDLHASYLIGADGARSRVAEAFGLSRNTKFLAGIEIECEPLEELDPRFLHCFADSRVAPGYIAGWSLVSGRHRSAWRPAVRRNPIWRHCSSASNPSAISVTSRSRRGAAA